MKSGHDHKGDAKLGMGGMDHGSGLGGMFLILLCSLPMIAIVLLLAVGVHR